MGRVREYFDEHDFDTFAGRYVKWYIIWFLVKVGIGLAFMGLCYLGFYLMLQNFLQNPPIPESVVP